MIFKSNEQIKDELTKLLIDEKVTKKDLAQRIDVSPQHLQNILNKKNLSFEDMHRLLSALGYDLKIEYKKSRNPFGASRFFKSKRSIYSFQTHR